MIRSIIIDDEEDGREAIRLSIEKYCPEVEISAVLSSPEEGIKYIKSQNPDLVFLDVQMPHKSGFEMLEELGNFSFEVIFVTAHDKYAIKAIKFSALDFLLKPVDIDELQQAVHKAKERIQLKGFRNNYESLLKNMKNPINKIEKLAIPTMEGIFFEMVDDIVFLEADRNYTHLMMKDKRKTIVSKNLKDFENMLSDSGFFRIHHAFLINMNHIKKYIKGDGGQVLMEGNHYLDVSKRKKEGFLNQFHRI